MFVTPRTETYEGMQHTLKSYIMVVHIMWLYHCNVGKTKRVKKNMKENIWRHQKLNKEKYVYFDNDPSNTT